MVIGLSIIGLWVAIVFHLITSILSFVKLDLTKWLEGLYLLAQMTSDKVTLTIVETLCTFFLLVGIFCMVHLSNEIESKVKKIEFLRHSSEQQASAINIQMGSIL